MLDQYLARLGLAHPGPPSVDALRAMHQAHVRQVPYENLEIYLGRPTTISPTDSTRRIVRGRGGYCYHLNGAFSLLLSGLGYAVRWHRAGVQHHHDPRPINAIGNHLALTVHGLPTRDNPDGMWLVDVGLGDGLFEPLPLRVGQFTDGPFRYALAPSAVEFLGWRFDHDPSGSFRGMDFRADTAQPSDFTTMHEWLSTAPESPFVQVVTVQRRDATGVDLLRGRLLRRRPERGERELTTATEWFEALSDVFGLRLEDLTSYDRDSLWRRVSVADEAWRSRV